jgi:hypothetical protein
MGSNKKTAQAPQANEQQIIDQLLGTQKPTVQQANSRAADRLMCEWVDDGEALTIESIRQCEALIRVGFDAERLEDVRINLLDLDKNYPRMQFAKNGGLGHLTDPRQHFFSLMVRLRSELAKKGVAVEYKNDYPLMR